MDLRPPTPDSATGRGLKTAVQAIIGFTITLLTTIWAVPGVPEAVIKYFQEHGTELLLMVGASSGLTSFIWNAFFRKDVNNY